MVLIGSIKVRGIVIYDLSVFFSPQDNSVSNYFVFFFRLPHLKQKVLTITMIGWLVSGSTGLLADLIKLCFFLLRSFYFFSFFFAVVVVDHPYTCLCIILFSVTVFFPSILVYRFILSNGKFHSWKWLWVTAKRTHTRVLHKIRLFIKEKMHCFFLDQSWVFGVCVVDKWKACSSMLILSMARSACTASTMTLPFS